MTATRPTSSAIAFLRARFDPFVLVLFQQRRQLVVIVLLVIIILELLGSGKLYGGGIIQRPLFADPFSSLLGSTFPE